MEVNIMRLDLTTVRCPDALIRVRKAITSLLMSTSIRELQVLAIEPSLLRDVTYYVKVMDFSLRIECNSLDMPAKLSESLMAIDSTLLNNVHELVRIRIIRPSVIS